MKRAKGLFDYEERQRKINRYKNPLQKLMQYIDFEAFRPLIESAFPKMDYKKGGRPPYDKILLFKIMLLQHFYQLSDEQIEFQIADRFTFMNFLDLELHDSIPDSNTTRNFRETLTRTGVLDQIFVLFGERLHEVGLIAREGSIMDATFVEVPRQRNSRKENDMLKNGEIPEEWSDKKLAHKDTDAKWTKKNDETHFGYKNHIKVDSKSKLIIDFQTTPAQVHDGEVFEEMLDENDTGKPIYGDSAYRSKEKEEMLIAKGIESRIHEKGNRGQTLTDEQKASNREKSRVRARVEHIFGWMHRNCQELMVHTIGLERATAKITILNLLFNMSRAIQIVSTNGSGLSIL